MPRVKWTSSTPAPGSPGSQDVKKHCLGEHHAGRIDAVLQPSVDVSGIPKGWS
ncbi:MAG TPA: hypothetical protein VN646_25325 [Candidatus Acidoferrum sp.]|nr:hypothetical protein [Candidatus Acidoferrum sp.]